MDALADPTLVVSHRGSVVQARVPRARVLWNSLHSARPDGTAYQDDDLVERQRRLLQGFRLRRDLEQPFRVGWRCR